MDKRSFVATLCVCGTVVISAVLFSHAGAPQTTLPNETPVRSTGVPPCPCPGDANCDGVVNFQDITTVLANWQRVCCPPGMACDDGDPCTIGDTCVAGQGCVGFPINCDDFDACTEDYCCQGVCIHVPIDCCLGVICDDGDPCTTDTCDPMTGNCVYTPIPGCGGCLSHADCDDGRYCTIDMCVGGMCQYTPRNCDDMNPCTQDGCDEVADICVNMPIPGCGPCTSSAQCDDQNPCTTDFCDGMSMMCVHLQIPGCGPCQTTSQCDDGMPCTTDQCVMGMCIHVPAPNGTACNDGNQCIQFDVCINGVCVGQVPIVCNDGDLCTSDVCDPMSGGCIFSPIPNCCTTSAQCDDMNPCTIDECVGGVCQHTAINCDDGNPCTNDSCVNGMCIYSTAPDGTACNDGNACTQTDTCQSGVCVGSNPVNCPVGFVCNPATGGCEIPNP